MISSTSPPLQNPRPSPVISSTCTSSRGAERRDQVAELGVRLECERIELLGPVQSDGCDPVVHGEIEVLQATLSGDDT